MATAAVASTDNKLTRGTKELIRTAIVKTQSHNRFELCEQIADMVEEKYNGMGLDYQLERMGLKTTGQILNAIDTYFYKYYNSKNITNE